MTRPEAYALIKQYGLQEEVKDKYGKNFTQVSTAELELTIETHLAVQSTLNAAHTTVTKGKCSPEVKTVDNPYEAACMTFVGILKDSGLLDEILAKL